MYIHNDKVAKFGGTFGIFVQMTGCSFLVILNLAIFLVKFSVQGVWNAITKEETPSGGDNDKNTNMKSSTTPYELPKSSTDGIISEQPNYDHPESGLGISTTTTTSFQYELQKYDNFKPGANYHSYDIVIPSKQHFKSQNCLSDMGSVDLDLKNVAVQSGLASRDSNAGDDTDTDTIIDGLGKSVEDSNPDDDFLQELAYYEKVNA